MSASLSHLNNCPREEFVAALGGIFEHSPWVAETVWNERPFADTTCLHTKMAAAVRAASHARQLALLRAHPELAGKAMLASTLTADSTSEQTRSGLTNCTAEELATLQGLNVAYNQKFGWPFIAAVKHMDRLSIIALFKERLDSSAADEFEQCLANIEKITRWRLQDQVEP